MKKGFTLIELMFVIIVISIMASFAVPKLMGTKTKATVTSIKRDTISTISAIQSYYMLNSEIDDIEKAIKIDDSKWSLSEDKLSMTYSDAGEVCVTLAVESNQITVTLAEDNANKVCTELKKELDTESFLLN